MRRVVVAFLLLLLAAQGVVFSLALYESWREYRAFAERGRQLEERLEVAQADLRRHREYLELLQSDPVFLERVVRRKLGYAHPDEMLLRFEDSPANSTTEGPR